MTSSGQCQGPRAGGDAPSVRCDRMWRRQRDRICADRVLARNGAQNGSQDVPHPGGRRRGCVHGLRHGSGRPAASSSLDALKTLGVNQSQVEQTRCWRRCWRRCGGWRCRRWCSVSRQPHLSADLSGSARFAFPAKRCGAGLHFGTCPQTCAALVIVIGGPPHHNRLGRLAVDVSLANRVRSGRKQPQRARCGLSSASHSIACAAAAG